METAYNYIIIKENNQYFKQESVLFDNKYEADKKYAFIIKTIQKDSSENIATIEYSNDLEQLQERANGYCSWYNYPMGVYKDMQQYLYKMS